MQLTTGCPLQAAGPAAGPQAGASRARQQTTVLAVVHSNEVSYIPAAELSSVLKGCCLYFTVQAAVHVSASHAP